jgi:hypothetical protein
MDESSVEDKELLIARLIRFYKGGITYTEFSNMSLAKIYQFTKFSARLSEDENRASNG